MIDPRFLSATQWCDATALALTSLTNVPRLRHEEAWQEWALAVLVIPAIAAFSPPDPRFFGDWRAWAERFVQCVPL